VGTFRRSLLRESGFALAAPLAALIAYFPAVVVPYAYMDDYFVLAWRDGLGGGFFKTATSFGRPLHAVLLRATFGLTTDIDSLRLVRLVSLVGVALFAVLLYYALRRAGAPPWLSAGACISVVTLASFQIYVAWAAIGEVPYVAALAGLAWLCLRSGIGLPRQRALLRLGGAGALLLCALLAYQPAAMFFWVFAAIDLLRPDVRLRHATQVFGVALGVAAVAIFFAYAAVRVGVHFYGGATSGRTVLVHDLVAKVRWFWNEPLVNSFSMFGLLPSVSVAIAVAALAAGGLLLLHAESGREAFGFLGLAICLVPLSYLPNLAVAEQFASYRSIGALATLLTIYVWLGVWGVVRQPAWLFRQPVVVVGCAALLGFVVVGLIIYPLMHPSSDFSLGALAHWPELVGFAGLLALFAAGMLGRRVAATVGALAASAFVVAGVVSAARNVSTLVVRPQTRELALLRSQLDGTPARVVFVKPSPTESSAPLARYDEFGLPSTYFAWVPNPAVALVWRERSHAPQPPLTVLASDQAGGTSSSDNGFVDMRALREHRAGWTVWTVDAGR
jgi:hypothetical protein